MAEPKNAAVDGGQGRDNGEPLPVSIDNRRLQEMIPHRYPFLMVDRVEEMIADHSAVGIKNVSINEFYFVGHFPAQAVMPGVLIIEAMAQTAAALVVHTLGASFEGKLVYFMSVDRARFRKPVFPGDQLRIHVAKERGRGLVWRFRGDARVGDKTVAEAVFSAMIRDS